MADSSLVYQGYVQGLPLDLIRSVNTWAMSEREPDVTFYLKISASTAWERIAKRATPVTSFEDNLAILEKAIEGFNTLVAPRKNVITLDAQQEPADLIAQALPFVLAQLEHS